jgi:hypothetical protein
MREKMIRRDKVDIVHVTQFNHIDQTAEEFLETYVSTQAFAGNLVVLAKRALKGAAAQKYGSGPVFSSDGGFFTKVRPDITDSQLFRFSTKSRPGGSVVACSIDLTQTRAEAAVFIGGVLMH